MFFLGNFEACLLIFREIKLKLRFSLTKFQIFVVSKKGFWRISYRDREIWQFSPTFFGFVKKVYSKIYTTIVLLRITWTFWRELQIGGLNKFSKSPRPVAQAYLLISQKALLLVSHWLHQEWVGTIMVLPYHASGFRSNQSSKLCISKHGRRPWN